MPCKVGNYTGCLCRISLISDHHFGKSTAAENIPFVTWGW